MRRELKKVAVWHDVTPQVFNDEIVPLYEPAILKGLVKHWPIVQAANKSDSHLCSYLKAMYVGGDVRFARLPPQENGLFAYNKDMTALNFTRETTSLDEFLHEVVTNVGQVKADTLALQSAPVPDYFPDFISQNPFTLFPDSVAPRVWIGNNAVVAAHYDDAQNVACLVSGHRRFTLFPPQQIENLYVGPIDFTPAGAPVSLVDFANPDFEKFPRFKTALGHGLEANLEPGDGIYIPPLWWHHVAATGGVNTLVNYWQGGSIAGGHKPVPADSMLLGMLSIRELPQSQKDAWQAILNYFVFSDQTNKHQHIPINAQGMLTRLSQKKQSDIRKWLISQLKSG